MVIPDMFYDIKKKYYIKCHILIWYIHKAPEPDLITVPALPAKFNRITVNIYSFDVEMFV